jgi:NAD-dependent dihydropyrimidine dehydrogenase PreA subunit
MTHIVTRLCLRDTACVEVCPVECMVLGFPEEEWPWLYIDPDTCIDCGACVPECPYEAIFPEEETPVEYEVEDKHGGGTYIAVNDVLLEEADTYQFIKEQGLKVVELAGKEVGGHVVNVKKAVLVPTGTILDMLDDIMPNYDYFTEGPGYDAMGQMEEYMEKK